MVGGSHPGRPLQMRVLPERFRRAEVCVTSLPCPFVPRLTADRSDTQSLRIEQDAGGALEVVGPAAELRNSQTRFGMWASNMTVGCSLSLIGAGTVAFYWLAAGGAPLFKFIDLVVDIYAMFVCRTTATVAG